MEKNPINDVKTISLQSGRSLKIAEPKKFTKLPVIAEEEMEEDEETHTEKSRKLKGKIVTKDNGQQEEELGKEDKDEKEVVSESKDEQKFVGAGRG